MHHSFCAIRFVGKRHTNIDTDSGCVTLCVTYVTIRNVLYGQDYPNDSCLQNNLHSEALWNKPDRQMALE